MDWDSCLGEITTSPAYTNAAGHVPARCGYRATLHQAAYTTVEASVTKAASASQERTQEKPW